MACFDRLSMACYDRLSMGCFDRLSVTQFLTLILSKGDSAVDACGHH